MTRQDITGCQKFPDSVGCSTSWIDIHHPEGKGVKHEYVPRDDWFEMPYRALVTCGFDNLYTASRCLSCTHEALGSLRTIPTGIMYGEAAGTAAALAAKSGVGTHGLDVASLQQALAAAGVFIGSAQASYEEITAPPAV